jgi:hypothetical protein
MKRKKLKRELVVDLAITGALVGLVLILSPGLAVVGMVALLVSLVAGAGFAIELVKGRRRSRRGHREAGRFAGMNGRAAGRSRLS